MPGDATVPGVAEWLQVCPGAGERCWVTPDPHSPLPLWLRIPLGATAGLGLGCCLCNGEERGDSGSEDANGAKLSLVLPLSPQNPPGARRSTLPCCVPPLPVPAAGPAARRLLTSAGKRSRGNEALCPPAPSGLEKAPAAAGRACCAQPLPRSPPGLSPPCALNPQCHTTKGKIPHSPQNFSFQRGEGVLGKPRAIRATTATAARSPPALKPPLPPPAACTWGWGDATCLRGPPTPLAPQPRGSQRGRSAHPCGMRRWRRTRSDKARSILQLPAASLARGTALGSLR